MIYVTGDTHRNIDIGKLNTKNFPKGNNLTKDDYVIIMGDAGFVWDESNENQYWLKWISKKPWTTLFVDGNHENFNLLNQYPVETWKGGRIHKITESLFHLMRGEVFTIDDKKFFCFGGAYSIDKHLRIENQSWWKEEEANYKEQKNAIEQLTKYNFEVDYVLTHTIPVGIFKYLPLRIKKLDTTSEFLETLKTKYDLKYTEWFSGHFHIDKEIENHAILFNQVVRIV